MNLMMHDLLSLLDKNLHNIMDEKSSYDSLLQRSGLNRLSNYSYNPLEEQLYKDINQLFSTISAFKKTDEYFSNSLMKELYEKLSKEHDGFYETVCAILTEPNTPSMEKQHELNKLLTIENFILQEIVNMHLPDRLIIELIIIDDLLSNIASYFKHIKDVNIISLHDILLQINKKK